MKKLLDSDWLRAVQFKCNTSAKSVTPVQITPLKDKRKFSKTIISRKTMTKIFVQKLRMRKKCLHERYSGISSVGNCIQRVVGSDSTFTNYLMN